MRELLKTLCACYGATGSEDRVAHLIREMVAPYVDEIRTDALGNLICVKRAASKNGKRVMLAAHTDHIGFVVTDADKNGFLRVSNMGGIFRKVSLNRHVVFENGTDGVLSYETQDFKPEATDLQALFIDIGAKTREEALSKVSIGDVAVYAPELFDMGPLVCGPAMDNRCGCAILVELLKRLTGCPHELAVVFTSQEEVGLRGAKAAAYEIDPDLGIALDVTFAGDTPKGYKFPIELGKGPAIKIMDYSLVCAPRVVKQMEAAAERAGVACQREVMPLGGTDAGAMQATRAGVPAGALSIPCRYVHSATETVCLDDLEGAVKLLTALLQDPSL